ncbi:MAG: hypothetical protein ABI216_12565 [Devosia sp.]
MLIALGGKLEKAHALTARKTKRVNQLQAIACCTRPLRIAELLTEARPNALVSVDEVVDGLRLPLKRFFHQANKRVSGVPRLTLDGMAFRRHGTAPPARITCLGRR